MGGDTPVYNAKNILEVPLGLTFLTRTMKASKMQTYFLMGQNFPILSKYRQVSKYTAFFPQKGLSFG